MFTGRNINMIKLLFNNGKSMVKFTIDGTDVTIKDLVTKQEFKATKKVLKEQSKYLKNQLKLRRQKGEKYYKEMNEDLKKFCSFNTQEEVEEDIMNDYVKKRGWTLVERKVE